LLANTEQPTRRQNWQAVLIAALCALFFLRDALLPGRALVPYPPEFLDARTAEALAQGTFDPVEVMRGNVSMGDKYNQSLCWDRVMQDRFRDFDLPLWTRDIAGGASFVPQMAQVYQPINLLLFLLPSAEWYGWWYFVHLVLFGFLCYRFIRQLGCRHASALLSLVCAVLSLWTQCKLHHNVILTAALSLWPMLSAVLSIARNAVRSAPSHRAVGCLALWTGLSWTSGFAVVSLQVSYMTVGFAALCCLQNGRGQRLRPFVLTGIGMALGGVLSLCHMAPVLLASAQSMRDPNFDMSTLAMLGIEWDHVLGALWPDLLSWGGSVFYMTEGPTPFVTPTRMPWAQLVLLHQPLVAGRAIHSWVETQFSIGLPATFCALLAMGDRSRRAIVWFFAAIALLAFWLACGDQPVLSAARLLPGVTAADVRRWLFCVSMALVVLAGCGADRILQQPRPWRAVAGLAIVGSISLGVWLWLRGMSPDGEFLDLIVRMLASDIHHPLVQQVQGDQAQIRAWIDANKMPTEAADNLAALLTTSGRSALIALLAAAGLLLRQPVARITAIVVLTAVELLHTGHAAVQTVEAERVTTPPLVLAPVLDATPEAGGVRPRLHRLAAYDSPDASAIYAPNLPAFHGVEDACAYNPLPPARLEQFFTAIEPDRAGKAPVSFGGAGSGPFHDPKSLNHPLLDVFGIRYVLTDQSIEPGERLLDVTPEGTGRFRLLERTTTLPRATFVRDVEIVTNPAERLERLSDAGRDARASILLEDAQAPLPKPDGPSAAEVEVVAHEDERVVVRVSCEADGYLRLADPYDPGWRAQVDGIETPVHCADHYLRAVHLPAGEHEVVFTFDAARVVWPIRISALALCAVVWLLLQRRKA
jgi:hypothetical protein